jgi:hypothetical protein
VKKRVAATVISHACGAQHSRGLKKKKKKKKRGVWFAQISSMMVASGAKRGGSLHLPLFLLLAITSWHFGGAQSQSKNQDDTVCSSIYV